MYTANLKVDANTKASVPGPRQPESGQTGLLSELNGPDSESSWLDDQVPGDSLLANASLAELRQRRKELTDREGLVSYWRRIIQARLDLLRVGNVGKGATLVGLNQILSEHAGANNRKVFMSVEQGSAATPIPGLDVLWEQGLNPSPEDRESLQAGLQGAERELSAQRRQLHDEIDATTAELVSRYAADPALALSALPSRKPRNVAF